MNRTRGSADTVFTIFTALCGATLAVAFIALGSVVARATFSPHADHAPSHQDAH